LPAAAPASGQPVFSSIITALPTDCRKKYPPEKNIWQPAANLDRRDNSKSTQGKAKLTYPVCFPHPFKTDCKPRQRFRLQPVRTGRRKPPIFMPHVFLASNLHYHD